MSEEVMSMQPTNYKVETERYAKCIEGSKRIRWDIDRDVLRGREFDFSKKFLPDGISKIDQLDFLRDDESAIEVDQRVPGAPDFRELQGGPEHAQRVPQAGRRSRAGLAKGFGVGRYGSRTPPISSQALGGRWLCADAPLRQHHRAGEKLFVDFAGQPADIVNAQKREHFEALHSQRSSDILEMPTDKLFPVEKVKVKLPVKARIEPSEPCDRCGEPTMRSKLLDKDGQRICRGRMDMAHH